MKLKFPNITHDERLGLALTASTSVSHSNSYDALKYGRLCVAWDGDDNPVGKTLMFGYLTAVQERRYDGTTFKIRVSDFDCELEYKHCKVIDKYNCPEVVAKRPEDGCFFNGRLMGFITGVDGNILAVVERCETTYHIPLKEVAYMDDVKLGLEEESANG